MFRKKNNNNNNNNILLQLSSAFLYGPNHLFAYLTRLQCNKNVPNNSKIEKKTRKISLLVLLSLQKQSLFSLLQTLILLYSCTNNIIIIALWASAIGICTDLVAFPLQYNLQLKIRSKSIIIISQFEELICHCNCHCCCCLMIWLQNGFKTSVKLPHKTNY